MKLARIAMPTSASDVSSIVQTLNKFKVVSFAIKSASRPPILDKYLPAIVYA